ncbi:MAG TPA: hypothetical protein VJK53_05150 [Candidatus Paceibacterota bacterium]
MLEQFVQEHQLGCFIGIGVAMWLYGDVVMFRILIWRPNPDVIEYNLTLSVCTFFTVIGALVSSATLAELNRTTGGEVFWWWVPTVLAIILAVAANRWLRRPEPPNPNLCRCHS